MKTITVQLRAILAYAGADVGAGPSALDQIVVPLDSDSERVVAPAAAIAERLGADLHLVTVKEEGDTGQAQAYLEKVAADVPSRVVTEVVEHGEHAAATIADAVRAHERVAVCMATHAKGRLINAVAPDEADTVFDTTGAPVFLFGPKCATLRLGGPVMFAHDGGAPDTHVGRSLVPMMAALGRSLYVVTVVAAPKGRSEDDPYHATREAVQPLLDAAIAAGMEASHHFAFGKSVADSLLDEIRSVSPSLVMMAAKHHSWLEKIREGSTTLDVVRETTVPVLVTHLE